MSLKTLTILVVLVGLGIAAYEYTPTRVLDWFRVNSGEQSLPGPLRGFIDSNFEGSLSNSGVLEFTNKQRDDNGLGRFHENAKLTAAANAKIDDMFDKQYFEHVSPSGKSPADVITSSGYEYITVGENLALGNFKDDETLVVAWMNSPGHRANILNSKYTEIGVAVRKGQFEGKTVWLAVQEFGAPLSSCPSPHGALKAEIESNRAQITTYQKELAILKATIERNEYADPADYNRAVEKYNTLAEKINTLTESAKSSVNEYNQKVNEFNKCLEQNS